MIIKGKPVRDFSLKLNTLFRGLGCLLLLLLLINLHTITDNLSNSAFALQQLTVPASSGEALPPISEDPLATSSEASAQPGEATTSAEDEIVELRQAALARFANKFNYPGSVEFYSLASNENWMFSPATVMNKDNVLNLTTCGYYSAKNAMGVAGERVPFIVDLIYDFLNQKYSVHGYFEDERSRYYQFDGSKKPVELNRNRFRNKWDVACKPLKVDKYDDILSLATVGRFEPRDDTTFKRQLNAFDDKVQEEIASCVEDEVLTASVSGLSARQNLCLFNAQCSILEGVAKSKCDLVNQTCSGDDKSLLCKTTSKAQIAS
ncbi:hypothetical protein [Photobacterium lipolyticum]|uniref:Uncharacterized protein n=1 Tax=Photobacterium lipolyticum TaxID=266810 RepID=A0A2T3MW61_9GAMM|nr:hypothetical protein [Photobacterium lipolyticum]PSW04075.1 hypothetical protein C9I89_15580 [Photobacterium lipolyticum]